MSITSSHLAEESPIHIEGNISEITLVRTKFSYSMVITTMLLVITDAAAISLSFILAIAIRLYLLPLAISGLNPGLPHDFILTIGWVIPVLIICMAFEGLYTKRLSFWQETRQVVKTISVAFLIIIASLFLGKISSEFSRSVTVVTYLFTIVLVPIGKLVVKNIMLKVGLWAKPLLILGGGSTGILVAQGLMQDSFRGYKILGFLDDNPHKQQNGIEVNGQRIPVLGGFGEVVTIIRSNSIKDVIIAVPGISNPKLASLTQTIRHNVNSITLVPNSSGFPVVDCEPEYFFDQQILGFRTKNNLGSFLNRFIKRSFDLAIGSIVLAIIAPPMIAIAILIKITSPGPVVFSHSRVGRKGEEFGCHKFRTMVVNAEAVLKKLLEKDPELRAEWDKDFKLKKDPRITPVGGFLRKTSLDELPQIFNVLKGEMSLIGPRPIVKKEIVRFGSYIQDYYKVRPGITGLWQVSGRNDIDYQERVRLEARYVHNWSMWLDISILLRTVGVVLKREGAY